MGIRRGFLACPAWRSWNSSECHSGTVTQRVATPASQRPRHRCPDVLPDIESAHNTQNQVNECNGDVTPAMQGFVTATTVSLPFRRKRNRSWRTGVILVLDKGNEISGT